MFSCHLSTPGPRRKAKFTYSAHAVASSVLFRKAATQTAWGLRYCGLCMLVQHLVFLACLREYRSAFYISWQLNTSGLLIEHSFAQFGRALWFPLVHPALGSFLAGHARSSAPSGSACLPIEWYVAVT